jgi:hypothetical protein
MIEHHADFAVPITQRLWLDSTVPRRNGTGSIAGWAIALGWWVDPGAEERGESVGTLYLVVDPQDDGPPAWVREGNVRRAQVREDSLP